jgi:glycosyltransferase involved in cell wall biosynthesis
VIGADVRWRGQNGHARSEDRIKKMREKQLLRVAHYYPWVYLTSGVERVLLQILQRSRHRTTLLTNHFDRDNTYPELLSLPVTEMTHVSVRRRISSVARAAAVIAGQRLPLDSFDALVVHCDGLGDLALARKGPTPALCFCHTPLRPVFDPEYRKRALARYRGVRRLPFEAFSAAFRSVDRLLWRRYRHVMFNSHETLRRAEKGGLLTGREGRYEVLHPGVDLDQYVPTWKYEPYFLVPGRIMWTKNIELALAAFAVFRRTQGAARFRLVIAGRVDAKSGPYLGGLRDMARNVGGVEFVVSPSDCEMRRLYADCHSVLFPSFNEDWGLVPLEANAYGKPVVAAGVGGPAESQVEGVTGFLAPLTAEGFAEKMRRLASDEILVRRIGETARRNAGRFDSRTFVSRLDEVVEDVVRANAKRAA